MIEFGAYAIVGGVAAGSTLVLTPIVRRVALRFGWVTPPDERRIHTLPTPSIGGVAMFFGFLIAIGVASQMDRFRLIFRGNSEPLGVVLAATVIFAVGLTDDLRKSRPHIGTVEGISAPAKVTGMVAAGVVLAVAGVTMWYFRVPFGRLFILGPDLQPLVTLLWVIVMANAINLVDGLDGLAAGIVAIASASFFLYSQQLDTKGFLAQPNLGPLVAIIVLGMCLGFLPHNFNPARIFMGDSGALLLGLLMAASTSVVGGRVDRQFSGQTYFFFAPLFIPLVILGVPIFDTLFAIVRRATSRQGLATADKGHLHHRLMRLGHGQRRSVLILWLWTAILSGFVLYPAYTGQGDAVVPLGIAALALALYTVLHPQLRRLRDEA